MFSGLGCVLLWIAMVHSKMPVIVDTDIGSAMDDTWALGLLLVSPEVDIKLIVTSTQNTTQRAQIVAKFLDSVGRTDIPIGIGISSNENIGPQYTYASDYPLENYPGVIIEDGIEAMIDTISSHTEISVLELAPATNLAEVILREPELVENRVRIVAMSGSIFRGYNGSDIPVAEYNVAFNVTASQIMYNFSYLTEMVTAPLDTAGLIFLWGDNYQRLIASQSDNVLVQNIFENYLCSTEGVIYNYTTVLCDVEATQLLFDKSFVILEEYPIIVTDSGDTVINYQEGTPVQLAMHWSGLFDFETYVTNQLLTFGQEFK